MDNVWQWSERRAPQFIVLTVGQGKSRLLIDYEKISWVCEHESGGCSVGIDGDSFHVTESFRDILTAVLAANPQDVEEE